MQKIELDIVALSHSLTQSQSYAVVLAESNGNRRLPIVIGGFEAQSIALALENMESKRPLTHDLTKGICDSFKIICKEIVIDNLIEGVFHSKLILEDESGNNFEIDSRTSDALAMALRFKSPIYTYEFILDQAGIVLEVEESNREKAKNKRKSKVNLNTGKIDFSSYTVGDLNRMLTEYLDNEEYEKAIVIRDELSKREEK